MGCSAKKPVNIYESEEFKALSDKDILAGESIWATTCFRCHMYGSNGGVVLTDKAHWDKTAAKGFDELYSNVLNGKEGVGGVMPPRGLCNSCSDDEIKKSVYYFFHLAKIVQDAESEKETENAENSM
ncbi:uncharacterized protein METZ01_LOCUS86051 [marine metagenome]|uniref:Cytochrome c domain-containing protein n=1 Tax=marine metagenome TaxID=408172 RepID=A0A381V0P8_9ZZZZ